MFTLLQEKCLELLPEVQRQQIKSGKFTDAGIYLGEDIEMHTNSNILEVQEPNTGSILLRPSSSSFGQGDSSKEKTKSSSIIRPNINFSATKITEPFQGPLSVLREHLFSNAGGAMNCQSSISRHIQFDDTETPVARRFGFGNTPLTSKAEKTLHMSVMNSYLHDGHSEQNGVIFDLLKAATTPNAKNIASSPAITKNHLFENMEQESDFKSSSKNIFSIGAGKRLGRSTDEPTDFSWR